MECGTYDNRLQCSPVKLNALWQCFPELGAHEAALGYRIDEHVSIELYYGSTGEDKLGIRGMRHL